MEDQPLTRIRISTHSQTIIRSVPAPPEHNCFQCGLSVPTLSVRGAAMLFRVSESRIASDLAAGSVHVIGPEGLCGLSLAALYSEREIPVEALPDRP